MGVCPLNPDLRVIKNRNEQIIFTLRSQLKDLKIYLFTAPLLETIKDIQGRYLYNDGILQDIQRLKYLAARCTQMRMTTQQILTVEINIEDEIRNSCLILQNQALSKQQAQNQLRMQIKRQNQKGNPSNKSFRNKVSQQQQQQQFQDQPTKRTVSGNADDIGSAKTPSFHINLTKNQSIVAQINQIYAKQIDKEEYSQSLKMFLKWVQFFNEHSYGGFLKPVYQTFCKSIYELGYDDFDTIVDEVSIFVQYMVKVYTEVYDLGTICQSVNGKLFKNENVYNLIMSFMFKKTKLKIFLRNIIRKTQADKIKQLQQKLDKLHRKGISFFQVDKKFILVGGRQPQKPSQFQNFEKKHNMEQKPFQEQHSKTSGSQVMSVLNLSQTSQMTLSPPQSPQKDVRSNSVKDQQTLQNNNQDSYHRHTTQQKIPNHYHDQSNFSPPSPLSSQSPQISTSVYNPHTVATDIDNCYEKTLRLVGQLSSSKESLTPVSKLKTILAVSKSIIKQIQQFYTKNCLNKKPPQHNSSLNDDQPEVPDIDPDNLCSIIIYLIAKNNSKQIYEELKLVEYFTTTNTMNSISGYYLNMFMAAIDSILTM